MKDAATFWEHVARRVQSLPLNWSQVRVYQDGLPDVPSASIARILEKADTPNYRLLRWLERQGARVMGTESPALLQEEYALLEARLREESDDGPAQRRYAGRASSLLQERDNYIARRIADTLKEGEMGLLFLGAAHIVRDKLPADIRMVSLEEVKGPLAG